MWHSPAAEPTAVTCWCSSPSARRHGRLCTTLAHRFPFACLSPPTPHTRVHTHPRTLTRARPHNNAPNARPLHAHTYAHDPPLRPSSLPRPTWHAAGPSLPGSTPSEYLPTSASSAGTSCSASRRTFTRSLPGRTRIAPKRVRRRKTPWYRQVYVCMPCDGCWGCAVYAY